MKFWDSIKDWLDSPSGHIFVSLLIVLYGSHIGNKELMTVGETLLARGMLGQNGLFRKPDVPQKPKQE